MKKFIKTVAILGIVLYGASKLYQKFMREPDYEEFDDNGVSEGFDLEAEEEETLADKIKKAAKSAIV